MFTDLQCIDNNKETFPLTNTITHKIYAVLSALLPRHQRIDSLEGLAICLWLKARQSKYPIGSDALSRIFFFSFFFTIPCADRPIYGFAIMLISCLQSVQFQLKVKFLSTAVPCLPFLLVASSYTYATSHPHR